MDISTNISIKTLNYLNNYNKFKDSILKQIHNKYLNDKVLLEDVVNKYNKKPSKIIKKKKKYNTNIDIEDKCEAKVWIEKLKEYKRCSRKKHECNSYCKIHLIKRNYDSI